MGNYKRRADLIEEVRELKAEAEVLQNAILKLQTERSGLCVQLQDMMNERDMWKQTHDTLARDTDRRVANFREEINRLTEKADMRDRLTQQQEYAAFLAKQLAAMTAYVTGQEI